VGAAGPFGGCGIAGVLLLGAEDSADPRPSVARMVAALAHRGPDGEGTWQQGPVLLGHRRLSILDLSARGRQPMTRGDLTITFNGEIYNFDELRRTLRAEGFDFETGTDTEVLLQAFARWGEGCLDRLNGMFAFALWDARRHALFLARDRIGEKPLYFYRSADAFLFASEVEALLRSGQVPGRPRWDAFCHQLLVRSYFECDLARTLVEGVEALPPGHLLWVHPDGRSHCRRYWQLPPERRAAGPPAELAEELRELLRDAVRLRMVSDVPVAAFLSGGVDSSIVNALACREAGSPLRSFTICYDAGEVTAEAAADGDLAHALGVARALGAGLDHRLVQVRPDHLDVATLDEVTDLATLADDERHPGVLQNYRAIQEQGLKAVLNGHGADETQAGYVESNPFVRPSPSPEGRVDVRDGICPHLSLLEPEAFHPDLLAQRPAVFEALTRRYHEVPGEPLRQGHEFLVWTQLQRVLRFEDFLSMRCGVECRLPFLDHRVVEWAFSLPFHVHLRVAGGGKALLRLAARELLPPAVAERPKRQFPKPATAALERGYRALFQDHRQEILAAPINRRVFRPGRLEGPDPVPLAEVAVAVLLWRWQAKLEAACAS
jgi:asparagine synthase (glutamine-hydrolysing)